MIVPHERCAYLRAHGCGPPAVALWRWLDDFTDDTTSEFFVGKATIAELTGFARNTVANAFTELTEAGAIVPTGRHVGRAQVYVMALRADPNCTVDLADIEAALIADTQLELGLAYDDDGDLGNVVRLAHHLRRQHR